jgi:stage V sporulation protein S
MSDITEEYTDNLIRVGASTRPKSVASVIAKSVIAGHRPEIRAIGASAVNQAAKACAIAAGYTAPRGRHLAFIIGFDDVVGDNGDTISAMVFRPTVQQ